MTTKYFVDFYSLFLYFSAVFYHQNLQRVKQFIFCLNRSVIFSNLHHNIFLWLYRPLQYDFEEIYVDSDYSWEVPADRG